MDMNPPVLSPWTDQTHLAGVMDATTVQKGPTRLKVIGSYTKPGPDTGAQDRVLPVSQWTSSVRPGIFHESGSLTGTVGAASAWNNVVATARSRRNLAQIVITGAVNKNTPNGLTPEMLTRMERGFGFSTNPADARHDFAPFTKLSQQQRIQAGANATSATSPKYPPFTPFWVLNPKPTARPKTPGWPPTTPGGATPPVTTAPVDPQAQLLASLFGSGGYSPISNPTPDVLQAPTTGGAGSSGSLVVWGAVASIAAVGYLVYRHYHKKAA